MFEAPVTGYTMTVYVDSHLLPCIRILRMLGKVNATRMDQTSWLLASEARLRYGYDVNHFSLALRL